MGWFSLVWFGSSIVNDDSSTMEESLRQDELRQKEAAEKVGVGKDVLCWEAPESLGYGSGCWLTLLWAKKGSKYVEIDSSVFASMNW